MVEALGGLPLKASVKTGTAQVGGGTLPQSTIESVVVALQPQGIRLEVFAERLRFGPMPVIGYIAENQFRLDLRTIFPRQDSELVAAIKKTFSAPCDER